jgi:UTP--glucose-1-phosphate uridylyltransferase
MHSSPNESQKEITKVVIPAAGWGTRFLPATKAMPKEMLPIIDKPVIQYVVEEAVASGDVVIGGAGPEEFFGFMDLFR